MVKPLTVYKASAGSGKTFTLATEYIKLVVSNPHCYRNILAVTFTNKATEEMKMRILSQLYGIWKQLPDSRRYAGKVSEGLDMAPDVVSQRAGMALTLLLHNYSYFRVETIDSFFQSVLRNLARELDLTANLRIGLNDVQVEEQAVDQLIDDLKTTDVVLQWIMKYVMDSIGDDRSWNVISQIKDFGKTIFRDYYKQASHDINQRLQEPGFFDDYTRQLHSLRQQARERMEGYATAFFDALAEEGFTYNDLSYGKSGVAAFFLKLQNGVFDESILGKRVTDSMGQPEKWYKKNDPRRQQLHLLVEERLDALLRQAVDDRPRQWKLYKSADLTLRHLSQLRLLNTIEGKVRELNDVSNRFLLSDTQQLLNTLIGESDSPFIFEKIGTQLEHIMIDEFQDTSTVQWQNFKHLLLETMSHRDTSNLIVGDVKQSIYRWRSGDWRLLNNIRQQFPEAMIDERTLDVNYRSTRHVVEFNNAFFSKAAQLEFLQLQDYPGAEQLARAYADVVQQIPAEKSADGYVSISLLTGDDYQQHTLDLLLQTVDTLLQAGYEERSVAILVRTNNLIPIIASCFAENAPHVSLVSDEAFRLDASQSVNILVQALQLLVRPDDLLVRAFLDKSVSGGLPDDFTNHSADLLQLPLYDLVERLYTLLRLDRQEEQGAYVCAFFDQVQLFASEHASGIRGFLKEWEEDLAATTIRSDEVEGIRLVSIHKSKGLEFDNVIIPFCDWQLEKQSGNVLWCQPTEAPFNQLPLVPIDYSQKGMTGTIYEADYRQEHLQNVVDNLNLLYVAFTRAAHNLFVIGKRGTSNSRSAIIEQVVDSNTSDGTWKDEWTTGMGDDLSALTFSYGNTPTRRPEKAEATQREQQPTANVFLKPVTPMAVPLGSFKRRVMFRQSNRSRDFISSLSDEPSADYVKTGNLLHQVFANIRTADDIEPTLQQLLTEGVIARSEQLAALLRHRLDHPLVADWFSHRWTVFRECNILSIGRNGEVVERRPDRVMTDGREWVVVDFKFGKPRTEYKEQVRQYMQLLTDMGHTPVTGYIWYVYTGEVERLGLT